MRCQCVTIPGGNYDEESDHVAGQEVTEDVDVGEPPFIIAACLFNFENWFYLIRNHFHGQPCNVCSPYE